MLLQTPPALAYRPFDGTDAGVADRGEFELELGPVGYLKEGSARTLIAPAAVFNYGVAKDSELVLEGKVATARGELEPGMERTSLVDNALSLKHVWRHGVLQDAEGVSVASECGVLFPDIHGEHGTGGTCALIASQRWSAVTAHLNGAMVFERDHRWNRVASLILEGPDEWTVRPVAELLGESEVDGARTRSALVGLIWRAQENLSFDLGLRFARTDDVDVREVRAGLTWNFAVGK
jgi:hypothetical protein